MKKKELKFPPPPSSEINLSENPGDDGDLYLCSHFLTYLFGATSQSEVCLTSMAQMVLKKKKYGNNYSLGD